jgi:fluoride exporter
MESPLDRLALMTPDSTSGDQVSEPPSDGEREARPPRLVRLWSAIGREDRLPVDPDLAPDDPAEPSLEHRPAHGRSPRHDPRELLAIGVGGLLGTAARYSVGRIWPTAHGAFPATTFAINTSGALALGILLTVLLRRGPAARYLRVFTCVGFLGAWTTMSTLATEADLLVKGGDPALALGYVGASLVAGLVAVAVGIAIGRAGWRAR